MENIKTLTAKGKEQLTHLVDLGKQQPEDVQTLAIVGGAALVGGIAVTAAAKGVLSIVGTLAFAPVSITVGAVAGGLLGWSYLQTQKEQSEASSSSEQVEAIPVS